jgi:hypothetical protein
MQQVFDYRQPDAILVNARLALSGLFARSWPLEPVPGAAQVADPPGQLKRFC